MRCSHDNDVSSPHGIDVSAVSRGGRSSSCARERLARWIALVTTLATLAVSAPLYLHFDKTSSALQFVEVGHWIPSWNVAYGMGVDGISLPFIFLSALLSVLCVGASWTAVQTRVREFYAALLVAETAMIGLFAATNFFLFYMFWELMVVPMFLLIGVWGGPGRVYAALKFLHLHAGGKRADARRPHLAPAHERHAGLPGAREDRARA